MNASLSYNARTGLDTMQELFEACSNAMAAYSGLVEFDKSNLVMEKLPWLAFVPADIENLLNDERGRESVQNLSEREQVMAAYMAADIIHAAYVSYFRFLTESVFQRVEDGQPIDTSSLLTMWDKYNEMKRDLVRKHRGGIPTKPAALTIDASRLPRPRTSLSGAR